MPKYRHIPLVSSTVPYQFSLQPLSVASSTTHFLQISLYYGGAITIRSQLQLGPMQHRCPGVLTSILGNLPSHPFQLTCVIDHHHSYLQTSCSQDSLILSVGDSLWGIPAMPKSLQPSSNCINAVCIYLHSVLQM